MSAFYFTPKSYQQPQKLSTIGLKKKAGEKRHSPFGIPYREKGPEKEISRSANSTVHRAGACASSARARKLVTEAVERALVAFDGTRGDKDSDEALWAAIAWRIGAERFDEAISDKLAEDRIDGRPKRPAAAFQQFLNRRFPKPKTNERTKR